MGVLRPVAISSIVILAGFLFLQGLGTNFGILAEIETFEDNFPTDPETECDWLDHGDAENINISQDCTLKILDGQTQAVSDLSITRLLLDSAESWQGGFSDRANIEVKQSNNYRGYITTVPENEFQPVTEPKEVTLTQTKSVEDQSNTGTTFSASTTGTDRLLLVTTSVRDTNPDETVTYAGQELQLLETASNGKMRVAAYYMLNPPKNANTVEVSYGSNTKYSAASLAFNSVNQNSPFTSTVTDTGATSVSSTITTTDNDYAVDFANSREPLNEGTGQTVVFDIVTDNTNPDRKHYSSHIDSGGTQTFSWSGGDSVQQILTNIDESSTKTNTTFYETNDFRVDNASQVDLTYRYQIEESAQTATLEFINSSGTVVESANLAAGLESNDFLVEDSFDIPTGDYNIRLEWTEGENDKQKFYLLDISQDASGLSNVSSGTYTLDIQRGGGSEIQIQRAVDNARGIGSDTSGLVEWRAYRDGAVVATVENQLVNGQTVSTGGFPDDLLVTGYGAEVTLVSENPDKSPLLESISVEGTEFDRAFGEGISELLRTALFVIFIAMALAYLAYSIAKS